MLQKLELSYLDIKNLKKYAERYKIDFLSSAFDIKSLDFLKKLKVKKVKIPSGEITNTPYLEKAASLKKPIIMSTGMANVKEISFALSLLAKKGIHKKNITILHCSTAYPTEMKDVNLNAMQELGKRFNLDYGYSDHTKGIEISIAAAAFGAKVIEKHLTLDKNLKGPDHSASTEPEEFKRMVDSIRNITFALGSKEKKISREEFLNKKLIRKSIVASNYIKRGDIFSEKNLTTKRPGNGLSPTRWHKIIGKRSKQNFKTNQLIVE
jgi:N,N'-diacetyllegionaminate synthase